jgi:hypothetical protein
MSSSRNSSAHSSRSNSRSATRGAGKGKSFMKRTFDKITKNPEENVSDTEEAGPSGIHNSDWEQDRNLDDDHLNNSDNEGNMETERGRERKRSSSGRSASISNLSNISPDSREKHLAYTRANPLGRMLLNLAADNLALQRKVGITESDVNAGELCTAFYNQTSMERKLVQKELKKLAEKTEENILSRDFESLCVNGVENMPSYFSKRAKLTTNAAKVEAMRIFPVKGKFSGNNGTDSLTIHEFFNNMAVAQEQMRLTEKEFIHMLLMCTAGKAHELITQWSNQNESIKNIYYNLSLQYDRRITPELARQKLTNLMAAKNTDLPRHISNIMSLADRASYALPQGSSRQAYYNNEAIQALIRSLPPTSKSVCSNLFHSLSAKARRAITFMELSRPLNSLRDTIDLDIKQNGMSFVNTNKPSSSNSKNRKGKGKGYSTYSVGTVHEENSTYEENQGKQRTQYKQNQTAGNQGNTAVAYQSNVPYAVNTKSNTGYKGNNGAQKQQGYINSTQANAGKGGKQRRYCSLCGKTTHTAAMGCRNMKDNNGQVVAIQPAQATCNICPATVVPRLNHPAYLCPFRPTGPLHGTR